MPRTSPQQLAAGLARFKLYLTLGNVVVLAFVAAATALALSSSYRADEARAYGDAQSVAQTLALNVASTVQVVDVTLQSTLNLIDQLQDVRPLDAETLTRLMATQRTLVPSLNALRVTDAEGWVLNPDPGAPSISVADRDYFRSAKADPSRLSVSEPLQGRLKTGWGLVFARARLDKSGRFAGVVYGGITGDSFVAYFSKADVGAQGAVSLRSRSMRLIARYSAQDEGSQAGLGTATVSKPLADALAANPKRGSFVARTALDGVERVSAYFEVPGYPLVVIAGLGTDEYFTPWRRQAAIFGSLLALLTIALIGASVALLRAQTRQVEARTRISQLAAERGAMLDSELVGMVRLRERREVWHNAALARLFGYAPGELTGQPARLLYLDDASFRDVGLSYQQLDTLKRFRTQLRMKRKDGSSVWVDLSGTPLPGGESLWMMIDISAIKQSEQQARHQALHDELTGLPNRHLLNERLAFLLKDAERNDRRLAVCYLDLDGFKAVNDHHGHDAGDAVLRQVATRLSHSVRGNDIVARLGGDEFVLVLNQLSDLGDQELALNRLLKEFAEPITLPSGALAQVGVSVGVAIYPEHGQDAETLLSRADHAMLDGKRTGKGRWVSWAPPTADGAPAPAAMSPPCTNGADLV